MMDNIQLIHYILNQNSGSKIIAPFLNICEEIQIFASKTKSELEPVLHHINERFQSSATRKDSLQLLLILIPQCSEEIFIENAISWLQYCIRGLGDSKFSEAQILSLKVLRILIPLTVNFPEVSKQIGSTQIGKILEQLQSPSLQPCTALFQCLEAVLRNYGGACGHFGNRLEQWLLGFVDAPNKSVMVNAARCMALLPLVGGGGTLGMYHQRRWNEIQLKVLATLHHLLDQLFDSVDELNSFPIRNNLPEPLALKKADVHDPAIEILHLTKQFTSVSVFLENLLRCVFPVCKTVQPNQILGVICRCLSVNSKGLSGSAENVFLGSFIPQIHEAALNILESLVLCCKNDLIMYGPLICKLIMQTLKWTTDSRENVLGQKSYSSLRCRACKTLTTWLSTSKSGSCVELVADQLIPMLVRDFQPPKKSMTLIEVKIKRKEKSKQPSKGTEIRQNSLKNVRANAETVEQSLILLQAVLESSFCFISTSLHQLVQQACVSLLLDVQQCLNVGDIPVPYHSEECRLQLYRLLHVCVLNPHPAFPPPTQYAFHIFSVSQTDSNSMISAMCTEMLNSTEKVLHPVGTSLSFPLDKEKILQSLDENQNNERLDESRELSQVDIAQEVLLENYKKRVEENESVQEDAIEAEENKVILKEAVKNDDNSEVSDNMEDVIEEVVLSDDSEGADEVQLVSESVEISLVGDDNAKSGEDDEEGKSSKERPFENGCSSENGDDDDDVEMVEITEEDVMKKDVLESDKRDAVELEVREVEFDKRNGEDKENDGRNCYKQDAVEPQTKKMKVDVMEEESGEKILQDDDMLKDFVDVM